jgi:hypothetical protein
MRDKWNVKKEGYLKIHIAVDIKTKKILSIKVTADEHVHDNKALQELVDNIARSDNVTTIGKLFVDDGTYEGNDVFDTFPHTMESCLASKYERMQESN